MAETVIGGHRGMDVFRTDDDRIIKLAKHEKGNSGKWVGVDMFDHNIEALLNEAHMLRLMAGSGYAPELIEVSLDNIEQEDLGDTEPPTDGELFRRNCVKMLATIRARGLRHGDLIGTNIITRDNHPYAIDWQEGHLLTEPAPQKQPWSDSHLVMRHIAGTLDVNGQVDTPRVARRWGVVLGALGATTNFTLPLKGKLFLDLGCFQGDFVALAAAEGMIAHGIDQGGFRTGENSIEIGHALWRDFPNSVENNFPGFIALHQKNIIDYPVDDWDVVMMFSTWPYLVRDFGWKSARDVLKRIITGSEVLFFETQLMGDGPGPYELKTDNEVRDMLHRCGASAVRDIGTFPVTGRPASRTVWEVRR